MELRRPRSFGDCRLGCVLWDKLQLSFFWNIQLADDRGYVPWAKVLQLLVVNRLIDPGSELRVHRQWFLGSAMDEPLEVDFAAAGKDRPYRCRRPQPGNQPCQPAVTAPPIRRPHVLRP